MSEAFFVCGVFPLIEASSHSDSQTQGRCPRTPASLLTELPLASCQRLPSGRHRTR